MGNRLSKIVTRTGDAGTTGLGDGTRVAKDCLRVEAMGEVDELNSSLGVLLTEAVPEPVSYTHLDVYKRQVHPRGRGERDEVVIDQPLAGGSSPRARGTRGRNLSM